MKSIELVANMINYRWIFTQKNYCARCKKNLVITKQRAVICSNCNTKIYEGCSNVSLTTKQQLDLIAGKSILIEDLIGPRDERHCIDYYHNAIIHHDFKSKRHFFNFNVKQIGEISCNCGGVLRRTKEYIRCFDCGIGIINKVFHKVLTMDEAKILLGGETIYIFNAYMKKYGKFDVALRYIDGKYIKEYANNGEFDQLKD